MISTWRRRGPTMGVFSWIVLGLGTGLLANRLRPTGAPGAATATVLGALAGAFLAGAIYALWAQGGDADVDPISLAVAAAGAAVLVIVVRLAGERRDARS